MTIGCSVVPMVQRSSCDSHHTCAYRSMNMTITNITTEGTLVITSWRFIFHKCPLNAADCGLFLPHISLPMLRYVRIAPNAELLALFARLPTPCFRAQQYAHNVMRCFPVALIIIDNANLLHNTPVHPPKTFSVTENVPTASYTINTRAIC